VAGLTWQEKDGTLRQQTSRLDQRTISCSRCLVRCVDLGGSRAGFLLRFLKKEISKHPILDVLRTGVSWRQHFTRNVARNRKRFLGHYYDFDQLLLRGARRCVSWRRIFGRFGISDGKANPSHQFYSFGIVSGVYRDYPNAARFGVRLNCSNTADDEAAEVQKQEHSRE